jgi:cation/acetate symporter
MVLGIFWRGTTHAGAVGGMLAGLGVTVYYMVVNLPAVRAAYQLSGDGLWWGIQPVSAGVFGVAAGLCVAFLVSTFTQHQQRTLPEPRY